jgi:hypothetical protein
MAQKARITIELVYDLDKFYGEESSVEGISPREIQDDLEDQVFDDLIDLMRGERMRYWSEIEIEEEK